MLWSVFTQIPNIISNQQLSYNLAINYLACINLKGSWFRIWCVTIVNNEIFHTLRVYDTSWVKCNYIGVYQHSDVLLYLIQNSNLEINTYNKCKRSVDRNCVVIG